MDNKNIFSENLKRYMNEAGKSRKDICDALGFSYFTFTSWVNGTKYPRMDKVELLADYFGIQKSDLIEDRSLISEKISATNDIATRLVYKMHDDDTFLSAVERLMQMNEEQLATFAHMDNEQIAAFIQLYSSFKKE